MTLQQLIAHYEMDFAAMENLTKQGNDFAYIVAERVKLTADLLRLLEDVIKHVEAKARTIEKKVELNYTLHGEEVTTLYLLDRFNELTKDASASQTNKE